VRKEIFWGTVGHRKYVYTFASCCAGIVKKNKRKMNDIKSRKTENIALTRDSTVDKKE
jgi:hypothetical protein